MHQAPLPVPLATVVVDLATAPVPTTTPRAVPLATVVVDLATAPVPTTTPRAAIPVPLTVPRTAPRTGPRHAHWYCPHQQAMLATSDEFLVSASRPPTPVTVVASALPIREPATSIAAIAARAVIGLRISPPW